MDKLLTFPYTGVLFNTLSVVIGSLIGLMFKKGFPQKITAAMMCGIGLCTVYLGLSGAISAGNHPDFAPVLPIIALAVGALAGTLLDIDARLARLGDRLEARVARADGSDGAPGGRLAEGFVSACLLFCVGSMTVVGGINAGVSGDNTLYFTKGVLDFVSAIALSVSFGAGVLLSSAFVLIFQGLIVLSSTLIEPLLTAHMIAEMNCVGSLLIFAIGLNLLGITKLKVANLLPAIALAMLLAVVM